MITPTPTPLTLALTGGGAKCAAHAGVLSVLAEAGLPVGGLAGVSAGGLVAVPYGLGYSPAAIRDLTAETHLLDVWELARTRRGVFGEAGIRARLSALLGEHTFAGLNWPRPSPDGRTGPVATSHGVRGDGVARCCASRHSHPCYNDGWVASR